MSTSSTSRLDLPNETLVHIAKYLDPHDLSSFLQTNKFFALLLTPLLHFQATQDMEAIKGHVPLPPLCWAAMKGHEPLSRLLLAKGLDVNSTWNGDLYPDDKWTTPTDWSALTIAASKGHRGVVKALLENGADIEYFPDPEADNYPNTTALREAICFDHLAICRFLIAKGADINAPHPPAITNVRDSNCHPQRTAFYPSLHLAVRKYPFNENMMALLIENGAHINMTDQVGNTALHVAARWDVQDPCRAAKPLLKAGINVNAQNLTRAYTGERTRETALVRAINAVNIGQNETEMLKLVKLLLENGANRHLRCAPGGSPAYMVRYWRHQGLKEIFATTRPKTQAKTTGNSSSSSLNIK